ncbi:flavodoxin [Sulfurospirillum sp. 1612]|uniref:flavodoxin n=1 Tax=Sulfurospirillum sp. 1612 TaxID=3094835 RepID=UPI002F925070
MKTAIFYGSDTGHTEDIAKRIAEKLGNLEIFDIAETPIEKMKEYDALILGIATWGEGDLPNDWDDHIDAFNAIDFSGKTVALFGLGDQEGYGDTFVDAMGLLYEKLTAMGAKIIGEFEIDSDYDYDDSTAIIDGKFVGLALDEDNQEELTDERIDRWVAQIKGTLNQ